ncbi:hypothetical protein I302_101725 [Kwoniella bestiolae CBS 10118]|uniref:Uncharacterized protein n=1 Tax=Kwoniella bestiolae CBS 10118 TaxID=1296100 RepID=A0A1B9GD22_9TREE|nr:hypothetical protein I302_00401 [Kwoniella bestiolae CBS 10118]OCF28911.1 hypothetical protein I302_00401 [Kwoniella bestiolae CBS 10118]
MPLPFFLQPLLLVAYYQEQLAQYIARWFQRSNEQLFGPLEQLVAAVVILGLAMQAPPPFWYPPMNPPIIFNSTVLPPSLGTGLSPAPDSSSKSTGNALLDRLYKHLPEWLQMSPVNFALLLMIGNVGMLMVGDDLRRRLRESWDLFWPPWQDRTRSGSRSAGTQVRFTVPESSSRDMDRKTESEKARDMKATTTQAVPMSSSAETLGTKAVENPPKDARDGEKEKLTESEKARKAKEAIHIDRGGASTDALDKGKARMDGERPSDSQPSSSSNKSEKANEPVVAEAPSKLDGGRNSRSIADSDTKATKSDTEDQPSSSRSTSGSTTDEDDPLMSGDYRPLRSSLKKSKKKPRQSKNIHHNYFLTMRGHRPALVPFPHGFHPKPHEPRNTLWWDNVPRNAEHIMAVPKVPKEPEDRGEDDIEEKDKGKGKEGGEKIGKDKDNDRDKERDKQKSKSIDEKKEGSSADKEKEQAKERERAKAKAEAETKAKAAKEAELKARAKAAESSQPETPVITPVDPKIQKATYFSQGLLSILLYYLNPQLGFLLLTFFVWQYINSHNELVLSLRSAKSSSSSSASSLQPGVSRSTPQAIDEVSRQRSAADPEKPSSAQPSNAEKIAELDKLITKLKSLPELTPEHKDKLRRAIIRRGQLIEEEGGKIKSTTEPSAITGEKKDSDSPKISVEELERKAKEMDEHVIRARSVENPSDEQKAKLAKAEERRKELWKQVRMAKGNEPASMMPSTSPRDEDTSKIKPDVKPEVLELEKKARQLDEYVLQARNIEHPSEEQKAKLTKAEGRRKELWRQVRVYKDNEPASMMPACAKKEDELKVKIKELEMYIMENSKVEDPSDQIKEKLIKAESKRRELKKELVALMDGSSVGSSGLSVDEKESLANPKDR